VTQLDPVQLRFSLPAADAATRRALQDAAGGTGLGVELYWADGSVYTYRGEVDFLASTVDPDTGNVVAQAVFPNPERALRPGETVRVRLVVERLEGVFMLPPEAVSQGGDGPKVFLVTEESTARARPVRLGPLVDGQQVVLEGLSAGDRVVINGQVALQDGTAVNPRDAGHVSGQGQGTGDGQG
jgi:membrane fusion protein (multidrug efflux system)